MKAKMRDNLIERYTKLAPATVDYPDDDLKQFLKSIEGKEVELRFVLGDAFEVINNNYWLPDCLWDEI